MPGEEGHLTLKEVISEISEMSVSYYISGKGWLLFRGKLYFSLANNDWTNRKSMVGSASSWESFVECCWADINQTNQQTSATWIDADGDQGYMRNKHVSRYVFIEVNHPYKWNILWDCDDRYNWIQLGQMNMNIETSDNYGNSSIRANGAGKNNHIKQQRDTSHNRDK